MTLKFIRVFCALALCSAVACTKSSPSQPSVADAPAESASVTDASTGITITVPQLTTPTVNQTFKFTDQPLTLTIKNGAHTGKTAATYLFEVATDTGFANKVYAKDGVAEGTGSTSLKIDTLQGPQSKTYYWHARTTVGSVVGQFTTPRSFVVGAQVVIGAPTAASPAAGGTLGANGMLSVSNASKTGPAGTLQYRFDVADSSSFGNVVFTATTPEQASNTSVSMTAKLGANGQYYWRAQATDPTTGAVGPYSAVSAFKFVPFQMTDATIVSSPPDLGSWPQTATITSVTFTEQFLVDFDRRDGSNRWGDTPFGDGSLQYTLGMCVNPNGAHWYCSAVVQFWYGRELSASGSQYQIGSEWFYDPARWGPIAGYQPQQGENVGLFVASGNLRNMSYTLASCPTFCERSNVAFVPWGSSVGGVTNAIKSAIRTLHR